MSLSNTTGYAIRALACLASCADPPTNIKAVADCSGVPQAYLAKIIKQLNNSGIVESKRGFGGGIWLSRPARLISLLDISIAVEGDKFLAPCLLGSEYCSGERACPTHRFWTKQKEQIRKELDSISLSDVIKFNQHKKSCPTKSC